MRSGIAGAFVVALLVAATGCKQRGAGSRALSEEGTPAAESGDATSQGSTPYAHSRWIASIAEGEHQVEANLEIDDLSGILLANVDGADQSLPFAAVRDATEEELAAFQRDVTNVVTDSQGNSVDVARGLVLVDGGGSYLTLLPVVSEQELVLFPFGSLVRTADAGEGEGKECGGMAGTACPSGQMCKRPAGATADQKGKCVASNAGPATPPVPPAGNGEGSKCGGPGIQCPSGFVCRMPSPPTLHGWGSCVKPAATATPPPANGPDGLGRACGGFAGGCPSGLKCSAGGFNQPGKCILDPNGGQGSAQQPSTDDPNEGRGCGGFAGGCPSGYKCSASGFNQPGKCHKDTPAPAGNAGSGANQPKPGVGQSCGGFAGGCPNGLKCKMASGGFNSTGTCVEP